VARVEARFGRSVATLCAVALSLTAPGCGAAAEEADGSPEPDAGAGPPIAAARCEIDLDVWTVEGASLVVPLTCRDDLEHPSDAIRLRGLPAGAEYDRSARALRWTPALDQAGNYTIELAPSRHERGEIRIGVADRFDDPDNAPIEDPRRYTHEYGLPVLHLGVSSDLNDDAHTPATLTYLGRELAGVSAKFRGATSRKYPKRSFTVKLAKDDRFVDVSRGFPGARRIVLTTTFDDNSQLRQRLAYTLWNRLDPSHIAIASFNAVVYLDGQYQGVYLVSDHVNDDFLEAAGLARSVNVYKAREHDANFRLDELDGDPKSELYEGYTKEEGEPGADVEGAYDDLEALVEWVATASNDEFAREWADRLTRRDFEDWLIFCSLIAAVDSAGKNSYLVHDPSASAADPRWRYIPWDFNASFGQSYRTARRGPELYDISSFAKYNRLFERLLGDERLRGPLFERYRAALSGPWQLAEVQHTLDDWASEVEAAALRDELKWGEAYRSFYESRMDTTSHREEVEYLRGWIAERWSAIDGQL